MSNRIVTASRLSDGAVVYLASGKRWTECLDDACVVVERAGEEALLAIAAEAVRAQAIVAPYAMDVDADGTRVRPRSQRERIRARGPTIRPDLGKQAAALG